MVSWKTTCGEPLRAANEELKSHFMDVHLDSFFILVPQILAEEKRGVEAAGVYE